MIVLFDIHRLRARFTRAKRCGALPISLGAALP